MGGGYCSGCNAPHAGCRAVRVRCASRRADGASRRSAWRACNRRAHLQAGRSRRGRHWAGLARARPCVRYTTSKPRPDRARIPPAKPALRRDAFAKDRRRRETSAGRSPPKCPNPSERRRISGAQRRYQVSDRVRIFLSLLDPHGGFISRAPLPGPSASATPRGRFAATLRRAAPRAA